MPLYELRTYKLQVGKLPAAVEEVLRYWAPSQYQGRLSVLDTEWHGITVPAGKPVFLLTGAANHDEREYADPDVFDIERRPTRILTFGAGTHACLGLHVAKMEGKVCFEELLATVPDYEVDETRMERLRTEFVQGFAKLPITFAAR